MKFFLINLLFIFSLHANAKPQVYRPIDIDMVPSEVALILSSLPIESLAPPEKTQLTTFINNFSNYAKQLEKRDLFFITKAEISKFILASRPDRSVQYRSYSQQRIEDILKTTDWDKFSNWSLYIFKSLLSDARSLINDPRYISLWGTNPTNSSELTLLRRRVELVLTWVDYLAFTPAEIANQSLDALALRALERIERAAWILTTLSNRPAITEQKKLFELGPIDAPAAKDAEGKSVDKIISPIIEASLPKLPSPVNDWIPSEIPNTPHSGTNIIKKKDPFYTTPANLPKPTNDWIMEL